MKEEAIIMGMPVVIEISDPGITQVDIDKVFSYFRMVDERFSTYKSTSEVERINRGTLKKDAYSQELLKILALSEQTKEQTYGYFDIYRNGKMDPSGLVKGYAIYEASKILITQGHTNFYISIGGDIQTNGMSKNAKKWKVGIENPFNRREIIQVVELSGEGIATSGTYIRGAHIQDPKTGHVADEIKSISVIGPNVYEADRFATAAFVMGEKGLNFIESLPGFEAYLVTKEKRAYFTSGFKKYTHNSTLN